MTAAAAPKSVGAPHRASWRTPTPAGHRPKSHVYAAHEGTRTRRSIDHSLIAPNRAMNSSRVGHMTEFGRSPSHSRLSARITAVSPGRISSISFHSKCGNARLPYPPAPDYAVARPTWPAAAAAPISASAPTWPGWRPPQSFRSAVAHDGPGTCRAGRAGALDPDARRPSRVASRRLCRRFSCRPVER
jgi:hypothetical protein